MRKKGVLIRTGRCAVCWEAAFADLSGRGREQEEKNKSFLPEGKTVRRGAELLLGY